MRCVPAQAVACLGLAFAALPVCAATPGAPAPEGSMPGRRHRPWGTPCPRSGGSGTSILLHGPHGPVFLRRLARQGARHAAGSGSAPRCEDRAGGLRGLWSRTRRSHGTQPQHCLSAPALPDAAAKPLHPGDLSATDARFVAFAITSDAFRNMGIGDCELVEEFTRQILRSWRRAT